MDNIIVLYYQNKELKDYFIRCFKDIEPHIKENYPKAKLSEVDNRRCNQLNVEARLNQVNKNEFLFAAYCHGSVDSLDDQYGEPFIKKDENDHFLENAYVFTTSCYSGKELGLSAIKKGAKLFFGFIDKALVREDYRSEFIACDNYPLTLFLKGSFKRNDMDKIKKKIKDFYNNHIETIKEKDYFAASCLRHNRDIFVIYM